MSTTIVRPRTTALFVLFTLLTALPVWAADYVLSYTSGGTTYYLARNGTSGVQRVSTFDPTTCIWSCSSNTAGTTAGTLNNSNTYGYLYQTVNGTRYFLSASANALALGTNAGANNYFRWRTNGTYVYNRYGTNTSYYINLESGVARNTTANTASNARPYSVTTDSVTSISTNPTINGNDVLTSTGNTTYTATGAAFRVGYTNYNFSSANHYFDANGNSFTGTPANATLGSTSWNLTPNDYATVNGSGVVNVSSLPESDITLTLTATIPVSGGVPAAPANTQLTGTKEITIQGTKPSAPIISISGTSVTLSTTATGSTTIRYTLDGTDPTASTGTVYSGAIDLSGNTTSPVTIKAITVRSGNASDIETKVVTLTLPAPTITADGAAGTATITCSITGTTIYYTTDGTTPTTSSTPYFGSLSGLSPMTNIKAIAVKSNWNNSPLASATLTIPSGISGSTVTIFDYEDHNWTYYAGVDASVDGGNYNTNYLGKMYSPNPRNVKITYKGNGGEVSIDESETEYVYYKTLEQGTTSGQYPYTVISNPFSKRPNGKGFGGWKIKEGAEYINGYNDEATLPLDADIVFSNLPYPTVNCTSAEIVFEATWVNYNNLTYANNNTITYNVTGGTYETNFLVLNRNVTGTITVTSPCTIMMVEPDGSADYRNSYAFTGNITPNNNSMTKIEWTKWNSTATVDARGRNMTIGRGVTNNTNGWDLRGNASTNNAMNQIFKIESGRAQTLHGYSSTPSSVTKQQIILGCDYDRAGNNNTKLVITGYVCYASATIRQATSGDNISFLIKSGQFLNNAGNGSAGTSTYCMYLWYNSGNGAGSRRLTIEGGEIRHIAGGYDSGNNQTDMNLFIRVKGGTIKGVVFGGAAKQNTYGGKCLVFTGGTVEGWIAGASNGFEEANNGTVEGETFVYVGGNTIVGNENTVVTNASTGGNIYGAGCGRSEANTSGRATRGTNVVFGDNAFVRGGVYGGGAYGYCPDGQTARVYITGGVVNGLYDMTYDVVGGVFGGARQNRGGIVDLYMTGGIVNGGVYGGSNATGTISGNVTMHINGGQVGTSTTNANVHGGGYGANTAVNGNVSVTLGASTSATDSATVYGNVYGGSAYGDVNDNANDNTTVTMNKALVNGNLFGGALGNGAGVTGKITVSIAGGTVNGNVYGGGDEANYTHGGDFPVVNMTGGTVTNLFGGGRGSTATITGNPQVTLSNNAHVTHNVYGGGDEAKVTGNPVVKLK